LDGALDHGGELLVAPGAAADVAGVDAVLGERLRARRVLREQLVPVEMEVADQRHAAADRVEPIADAGHGRRRLGRVHGDAHQLRAGARQLLDLARGGLRVLGVGIGHRLHDDRRAAADGYASHPDLTRNAAVNATRRGVAHGRVKRAMASLVCGARSTGRSLCSTRTCAALPITSVSGPRACTTRSAPAGLSDDTSMRSFASLTSIQASSSHWITRRLKLVPAASLACAGGAAFSTTGVFWTSFSALGTSTLETGAGCWANLGWGWGWSCGCGCG